MVTTSTIALDGQLIQIHHIADTSLYMGLIRDVNGLSRALQTEKERDGLTGLYNKGKFMALSQSLFRRQEAIAVFNMDVNNLKHMNDTFGHEMGDRLILKAAASLKLIEARNVIPFRVGGDEFIVVALHMASDAAEALRARWQAGLDGLHRLDDGIRCVIACGMACGEAGYVLEDVLALADRRMYEDKRAKKAQEDPS